MCALIIFDNLIQIFEENIERLKKMQEADLAYLNGEAKKELACREKAYCTTVSMLRWGRMLAEAHIMPEAAPDPERVVE